MVQHVALSSARMASSPAPTAGRCARASVPANMSMQCTSSGGTTCCKCASIADHLSGLRAREMAVMRKGRGDVMKSVHGLTFTQSRRNAQFGNFRARSGICRTGWRRAECECCVVGARRHGSATQGADDSQCSDGQREYWHTVSLGWHALKSNCLHTASGIESGTPLELRKQRAPFCFLSVSRASRPP